LCGAIQFTAGSIDVVKLRSSLPAAPAREKGEGCCFSETKTLVVKGPGVKKQRLRTPSRPPLSHGRGAPHCTIRGSGLGNHRRNDCPSKVKATVGSILAGSWMMTTAAVHDHDQWMTPCQGIIRQRVQTSGLFREPCHTTTANLAERVPQPHFSPAGVPSCIHREVLL